MSHTNFRRTLHRLAGACAAFVALFVATGQAHAQVLVTDTTLLTSNEKGQASQLAQLLQQYTQMVTQYESMLTTLKSLNLNVMQVNNQLPLITDVAGQVAQACPGSSSLVGSAMNMLGMDSSIIDGQIVTQQRTICAKITTLQVDKYNTVAKMLNHMNDYFAGLKQLNDTADQLIGAVSNAIGNREALQNQTSQTQAALSAEMANVEQHLRAVDATIAALQNQQSLLANIALKGSNATGPAALAGQIIQAGAFAAAFPQP